MGQPGDRSNNAFTSYYCIGFNGYVNNTSYFDMGEIGSVHHLHNYSSLDAIFKSFNTTTTLTDTTSFELHDSIATNVLGNDGTQVGIYGGLYPFNPRVNYHKVTVPIQTTSDGKLNVDIEPIDD